ncbi:unnamed protein product [Thelazia callipaeda]|uniref:Uncharacterized protein n=1 Tax=Thelazia callipaeda TaxID=103827 RepID=A0A0N5D070_THECL|nr:unnamed protein product [Thelazia callipaeda]
MGCCTSNVFHDEEKGLDDHLFPYFDYDEQPEDEYKQLDTENDQKGDTAVEHIFKKTKTVYGQPPKDMINYQIDWADEYQIEFKNRPCPYDFPAFEGDKPPDYDEKVTEYIIKREMSNVDKATAKSPAEGGIKKTTAKVGGEKDRRKKSSGKKDSRKKAKNKRSINDMDQCSISDK